MDQPPSDPSDKDDNAASSSSQQPGLLGLFNPPPPPTSPSSPSNRIPSNPGIADDGDSPSSSQAKASTTAASNNPASPGSFDHLSRLFSPPAAAAAAGGLALPNFERPRGIGERQATERRSNRSSSESSGGHNDDGNDGYEDSNSKESESTPLLAWSSTLSNNDQQTTAMTTTPTSSPLHRKKQEQQQNDYDSINGSLSTPVTRNRGIFVSQQQKEQLQSSHVRMPSSAMPAIHETKVQTLDEMTASNLILSSSGNNNNNSGNDNDDDNSGSNSSGGMCLKFVPETLMTVTSCFHHVGQSLKSSTTYIGSFMYLLYHVVFCLALGSAIMRPSSPNVSLLGLMTKTAALGTVTASPIYWASLSGDIPALYPTADLFLAPFLAQLALDVDNALSNEVQHDETMTQHELDSIFLSTFGVLTAITALLCDVVDISQCFQIG